MAPKTKLFVGHLPDGLRTEELSELFAKYGTVTECDVINKYGFVHMSTEEEAEEALKNLNNYNFMGSTLSVERSTSKFHQEPGAPGRAKGGPSRPPYGGGMARNGYDGRGSGGYYNGGPGGYGDYRRGGDFYDRAPYRAMVDRPRPYPAPYERRDDPYAPRRPPGPPSMGPDMYERRPAPDYALYSRRSPPPASGYSWGAGYGSSDRMGGYSYGGY